MRGKKEMMQSLLLLAGMLLLFSGYIRDEGVRRLESGKKDDEAPESAFKPTFDTKDRFVLSTIPRPMTGEDPDRVQHIKFHLHCVADAMKKSDFHTIFITSDEYFAEYINSSEELPMEVVLVEPKNELLFTETLQKMFELHPNAKGYGFFNGDICPTPGFIDAANEFFKADCPDRGFGLESKWRFVSGLRYNVQTHIEKLDLHNALDLALQWPRSFYKGYGADFLGWNREMFLKHILPETPDFSVPLVYADHFLFEDGNCNALTLLPEYGWEKDAVVLHLDHYPFNGMPLSNNKILSSQLDNSEYHFETTLFDKTNWKTSGGYKSGKCNYRPYGEDPNDCHFDHASKTFNCKRDVGHCYRIDVTNESSL